MGIIMRKILIGLFIISLFSISVYAARCITSGGTTTTNGRTKTSRTPNQEPWGDNYILADGNNPFTADVNLGGFGFINTGYTEGSVLFIDPNGDITEDNTNFYWDNANNRLGIGINTGFDPRIGLTILGDIDILHTASFSDDHALELDIDAAGFGDIKAIDNEYSELMSGTDDEYALKEFKSDKRK